MHGRYPVDCCLDLPAVRRVSATRLWIIGTTQFRHLAARIFYDLTARNEISVAQPHLCSRREPEEFLRRALHEVVLLDIKLAAELYLARASFWIVRMIGRFQLLNLPFRIIFNDDLERP